MIVAIANRKGGTGKTTTAVNLAAEWAVAGYATLLVDLDTQGHAALGVGCGQPRPDRPGIHRIFHDPEFPLQAALLETGIDSLTLLPADPNYLGDGDSADSLRLARAFKAAKLDQHFDRIVLDTPPTLDTVLINALSVAQGIIAPFVPHHLAGVAVRQLAKLFYRIATQENPGLSHFSLVPVMLDRRLNLHQRVIGGLRHQFGKQRLMRGIRNNISLAEAFEQGLPARLYAPRSPGAMDYKLLSSEIDALWNDKPTSNPRLKGTL